MKNHHPTHPHHAPVAAENPGDADELASSPLNPQPPTHDQIAKLAYDIYLRSGSKPGHCTRNWQEAEQSILNRAPAAASAK